MPVPTKTAGVVPGSSWWNQRMTRDTRSNTALEVHSRHTRVEPATGWRCRRRRTNDWGQRRERSPVSLSLRTPPAHCLMIGLITDTLDLISKQGRRQSHSRALPTSFSNSHCAPEHGPSASVNGQCWQPSAQGQVPFSPLLHQRPSNALIPFSHVRLIPFAFVCRGGVT